VHLLSLQNPFEHFSFFLSLFPVTGNGRDWRRAGQRGDSLMDTIFQVLIVLFEVIQDTGTGA
jgi:hypothetical protein